MWHIDVKVLNASLSVLVILAGALVVWTLLVRAARRARRRYEETLAAAIPGEDDFSTVAMAQRRLTALRLIVNAARYTLAIAVLLTVIPIATMNTVKLDALLLPTGFLAAALGLGAQNLVRDLVSGFFIIFEGMFAVGDIVSINGVLGEIEEVGLRVTRLRDENAQLHFFPNGAIATVAKYPHRYIALSLLVPLESEAQSAAAQPVVAEAIERFQMWYDALVGTPEFAAAHNMTDTEREQVAAPATKSAVSDAESDAAYGNEPVASILVRLLARPERASRVRQKLPGIVTTALSTARVAMPPGLEVEVLTSKT